MYKFFKKLFFTLSFKSMEKMLLFSFLPSRKSTSPIWSLLRLSNMSRKTWYNISGCQLGGWGAAPQRFSKNFFKLVSLIQCSIYVHVYQALVHFSTWIDFYRGCWYGAFGMTAEKKCPQRHTKFWPPQEICELAPTATFPHKTTEIFSLFATFSHWMLHSGIASLYVSCVYYLIFSKFTIKRWWWSIGIFGWTVTNQWNYWERSRIKSWMGWTC